jgi:hypothetical protein
VVHDGYFEITLLNITGSPVLIPDPKGGFLISVDYLVTDERDPMQIAPSEKASHYVQERLEATTCPTIGTGELNRLRIIDPAIDLSHLSVEEMVTVIVPRADGRMGKVTVEHIEATIPVLTEEHLRRAKGFLDLRDMLNRNACDVSWSAR